MENCTLDNYGWCLCSCTMIIKAENYKPRFPISSAAPCALGSLFTSVQHCLEMLVHYLVTLSYKPRRLHCISAGHCFYNDMRFVLRVKTRTAPCHSAYNSLPRWSYTELEWMSVWVTHWYRVRQWARKSRDHTRPRQVDLKFLKSRARTLSKFKNKLNIYLLNNHLTFHQ